LNRKISTADITLRLKLRLKVSTRPAKQPHVFDLGSLQA
jgi:hypothetical protein